MHNRSIINPFSVPRQTPEDRAILDALRKSMAELAQVYGCTWTVFPSRYERIYGKVAA